MDDGSKSPLERAFQLARSGQYANVSEVRDQLRRENYSIEQVSGLELTRQLRELIATARGK
jgi:hypothetical protein